MSQQESTPPVTQRWLSNAQMRLALLVFEILLERNGQVAVLHLAGLERYIDQLPPDNERAEIPRGDIIALFAGVVSMFGDQGARGVFRRWGRAFAERRLNRRPALRLMRIGLRLLPAERSAKLALARLLHHIDLDRANPHAPLEDDGEYYRLMLSQCLYCHDLSHTQPNSLIAIGLIEGLLRWATGHDYDVNQDAPDTMAFKIRKRPIGPR
jgi:hypothetical protein